MSERLFKLLGLASADVGYKHLFESRLHLDVLEYNSNSPDSTWVVIGDDRQLQNGSLYVAAHIEYNPDINNFPPLGSTPKGISRTFLQEFATIVGPDYLRMLKMMTGSGKLRNTSFIAGSTNEAMARFCVRHLGFKYFRTQTDIRLLDEITRGQEVNIIGFKEDLLSQVDSVRGLIKKFRAL